MSILNLINKLDLPVRIPENGVRILRLISVEGKLNQTEICDHLELSKRQVTYAVDKLREGGLIREEPDIRKGGLADFRSKLISLSSIVENDLFKGEQDTK